MNTGTIVSFAIVLIVGVIGIAASFYIKRWLVKRALSNVIRIFHERGAIDVANAKTIDDLGLSPRTRLQNIGNITRDYKQQALRALMEADIVRVVEGDRVYLSRDKLAEYRL